MNHKTLTLTELKEIARNIKKNGCANRKEIKLSRKEDIVDRVLRESEKLVRRLRTYY